MARRLPYIATLLLIVLCFAGCASQVIPEDLRQQIDTSISFGQVLEDPDSYRGRTVLWGGEVLRAKALSNATELEVLQLPLAEDQAPVAPRTESKGRFLALNKDFVDPATFAEGARVTVVGEVTGSSIGKLDDTDYRYPVVEVRHLHRWDPRRADNMRPPRPWWGVFGGVGVGAGTGTGGGISIGTGF